MSGKILLVSFPVQGEHKINFSALASAPKSKLSFLVRQLLAFLGNKNRKHHLEQQKCFLSAFFNYQSRFITNSMTQ